MLHRNPESDASNQGFHNLEGHLRMSTFAFLCSIGQFIKPVILERKGTGLCLRLSSSGFAFCSLSFSDQVGALFDKISINNNCDDRTKVH